VLRIGGVIFRKQSRDVLQPEFIELQEIIVSKALLYGGSLHLFKLFHSVFGQPTSPLGLVFLMVIDHLLFNGQLLASLGDPHLLVEVQGILPDKEYLVLEFLIVILRVLKLCLFEVVQALSPLLHGQLLHGLIHFLIVNSHLLRGRQLHLSEGLLDVASHTLWLHALMSGGSWFFLFLFWSLPRLL
jgi:hypothetical protein